MVGIGGLGSPDLNPLQRNLRNILDLQTQLSTGRQINRASDNPAGLVISERLGAEFEAFRQGIENTQRAANIVDRADGALGETSRLLVRARELSVAAGDGTLSAAERDVLQNDLDGVLGAIDRIGNTADFAGIRPLDGSLEPRVANQSPGINRIVVDSVGDPGDTPRTINVTISAGATRAVASGTITGQTTTAQVVVRGSRGSAAIDLAAGSSASDVEDAINAVTDQTGVEAVGGQLRSTGFGSAQFVDIEELSGDLEGVDAGNFVGTDIQGTINGQTAAGSGTTLSLSGSDFDGSVTFDPAAAPGDFNFDITSPGFATELGTGPASLGIQRATTDSLGASSGIASLTSLFRGGENSLVSNPSNATEIIDSALTEVNSQRARLGGFSSQILESNQNFLEDASLNLASARSRINDTDFARTTAELTARQIQLEAQTSLQAQALGIQRESLLSLLGT